MIGVSRIQHYYYHPGTTFRTWDENQELRMVLSDPQSRTVWSIRNCMPPSLSIPFQCKHVLLTSPKKFRPNHASKLLDTCNKKESRRGSRIGPKCNSFSCNRSKMTIEDQGRKTSNMLKHHFMWHGSEKNMYLTLCKRVRTMGLGIGLGSSSSG